MFVKSLLRLLPAWQNALLAVLSALLLILAFPPFEWWFTAWFAFVPLLWAVEREGSVRRSFVLGWLFGNVFFCGTCWWLTFAPITYAGFPALLAYVLLSCVTSVAAVFPGVFATIIGFLLQRFGTAAFLLAPFIWVFSEFARYWITGNNWNAIGYSQAFVPNMMKSAAWGGVYLAGFLVVLGTSILAFRIRIQGSSRLAKGLTVAVIILAILSLANLFRTTTLEADRHEQPAANVIAIQPNIPMSGLTIEKWKQLRERHVRLAETLFMNRLVEGYSHMPYETKEQRQSEELAVLDELDRFGEKFSLDNLRTKRLTEDSRELRVWVGFAPDVTRGLILSEDSAKLLPPIGESPEAKSYQAVSLNPPLGWDEFWKDSTLTDLLSIPDEPPTERIESFNDSDAVIIEIRKGDDYRYVMYHAPCHSRGMNARKVTATLSAVGEKLGSEIYRCDDESRSKITQPRPTIVVFPESPMNFMYEDEPETKQFINSFAAKHNVSVLFNSAEPDASNGKYFNSAVLVGPDGKEIVQYDKIYLLPFGEAVPFPLEAVMPAFVGSFSHGKEYDLLPLGEAKAGVMICFESHFGQLSREYVRRGADVIIEMTNDGYLGPTPVLRQHLANAVFRAVETNRPVLRVTNVGITAYINERGEVVDPAVPYTEDTRVWTVAKSDGSQTFYVKCGDWFAWLCTALTVGLVAFAFMRKQPPLEPPAASGRERSVEQI